MDFERQPPTEPAASSSAGGEQSGDNPPRGPRGGLAQRRAVRGKNNFRGRGRGGRGSMRGRGRRGLAHTPSRTDAVATHVAAALDEAHAKQLGDRDAIITALREQIDANAEGQKQQDELLETASLDGFGGEFPPIPLTDSDKPVDRCNVMHPMLLMDEFIHLRLGEDLMANLPRVYAKLVALGLVCGFDEIVPSVVMYAFHPHGASPDYTLEERMAIYRAVNGFGEKGALVRFSEVVFDLLARNVSPGQVVRYLSTKAKEFSALPSVRFMAAIAALSAATCVAALPRALPNSARAGLTGMAGVSSLALGSIALSFLGSPAAAPPTRLVTTGSWQSFIVDRSHHITIVLGPTIEYARGDSRSVNLTGRVAAVNPLIRLVLIVTATSARTGLVCLPLCEQAMEKFCVMGSALSVESIGTYLNQNFFLYNIPWNVAAIVKRDTATCVKAWVESQGFR